MRSEVRAPAGSAQSAGCRMEAVARNLIFAIVFFLFFLREEYAFIEAKRTQEENTAGVKVEDKKSINGKNPNS